MLGNLSWESRGEGRPGYLKRKGLMARGTQVYIGGGAQGRRKSVTTRSSEPCKKEGERSQTGVSTRNGVMNAQFATRRRWGQWHQTGSSLSQKRGTEGTQSEEGSAKGDRVHKGMLL